MSNLCNLMRQILIKLSQALRLYLICFLGVCGCSRVRNFLLNGHKMERERKNCVSHLLGQVRDQRAHLLVWMCHGKVEISLRVLAIVDLLLSTIEHISVCLKFHFRCSRARHGTRTFRLGACSRRWLGFFELFHVGLVDILATLLGDGLAQSLVWVFPLEWRFDLVLCHQSIVL